MKRNSYSSLAFAAVDGTRPVWPRAASRSRGRHRLPRSTRPPQQCGRHHARLERLPRLRPHGHQQLPGPDRRSMTRTWAACGTNLHVWAFSEDGITPAAFENCSHYSLSTVVTFTGRLGRGRAPALALVVMCWGRATTAGSWFASAVNGEIACFGGRLPFYSFTAAYGVHLHPGHRRSGCRSSTIRTS